MQKVRVEVSPTSYLFEPGHAVCVRISSGSFPLIAANPNTGRNALIDDHVPQVATHTVLHAKNRPSSIFLPECRARLARASETTARSAERRSYFPNGPVVSRSAQRSSCFSDHGGVPAGSLLPGEVAGI